MVGYIYLITDTTNGMKYAGKHHYNKEGELDPNYHGSGTIISRIYKERPETLKEEYIKTCYSEEEMNNDEKYYIKLYDTLWPNGYNLSEGGDGVIPCEETRRKISEKIKEKFLYDEEYRRKIIESHKNISEESRRKMSESRKKLLSSREKHPMFGKHHSEETKKKLRDINKGKHLSDQTKQKISESISGEKHHFFGKHHTEETKKKISSTKKGKQLSDETRRKMSESRKGKPSPNKGKPAHNKGKPMSEEQKKKLSEAHKNISDETRKKMRDSHKGKHPSEETKQKMREAHQKRKLQKQLQPDGCLPLW